MIIRYGKSIASTKEKETHQKQATRSGNVGLKRLIVGREMLMVKAATHTRLSPY